MTASMASGRSLCTAFSRAGRTHRAPKRCTASYRISLAVEDGQVVGLAQAVSDGVLTAFIPLLEVQAPSRGRGTGSALIRHLLAQLDHLYAVDLSWEGALVPFYERLGFRRANGMVLRNYAWQHGGPLPGLPDTTRPPPLPRTVEELTLGEVCSQLCQGCAEFSVWRAG